MIARRKKGIDEGYHLVNPLPLRARSLMWKR
jgi:hypothetical protein